MKSYTDLEQSRKLAKILPIKSADNYYSWHDEQYYVVNKDCPYPYSLKEKIPCWSLAALLDVIPYNVTFNKAVYRFKLVKFSDHWECYYQNFGTVSTEIFKADNSVDVCVEMILKLKEKNLL